jgi:copper(I)-binding protein
VNRKTGLAGALVALWLLGAGSIACAELEVSGAWARATMPGQKVAGVYMQLRSDVQSRLVGVKTDAAKTAEVHQMSHEGGVMRMRRLESLDLPAGKTVTLEPGGYHLMLLDILRPLKAGDRVSVTLVLDEGGKRVELPVQAEVRSVMKEEEHGHH